MEDKSERMETETTIDSAQTPVCSGETGEDAAENGAEGQNPQPRQIRKHFSRLGLWYFTGTIIINVAQLLVVFLCRAFKPEWLNDVNFSIILSALPLYLIGAPALAALVRTVPGRKPEKHKMKAGHFILALLMCFAIMYICNIAGNVITSILGALKGGEVQNVLENTLTGANPPLVFLYTVICAPIVEEYLFRKLIVDRTIRYGQGVAVLLSGLMFGLFHGNLNQFAYTFFLGMFLAFLYVRTGNLKITIGLHMGVNFVGGMMGLLVMDMLDMDKLNILLQNPEDTGALIAFFMDNVAGLILLLIYDLVVYGSMLAGGILLIVSIAGKRFRAEPAETAIPKGKRFRTVILNPGMLLYCIFWIAVIVLQIFM